MSANNVSRRSRDSPDRPISSSRLDIGLASRIGSSPLVDIFIESSNLDALMAGPGIEQILQSQQTPSPPYDLDVQDERQYAAVHSSVSKLELRIPYFGHLTRSLLGTLANLRHLIVPPVVEVPGDPDR